MPVAVPLKLLNRRQERRIADTVIADPEQHTTMDRDGAVRSIQAANVEMPLERLDALWSPMHLERLARTYWKFLSRVTLGLIRVHYSEDERAVVFITRPFVLLRFHPPDYELSANRGIVRWRIRDGLLVAKPDQGYLEIDVRRMPSDRPGYGRVHIEVEVSNFYPALAHFFARWFYANTQSRIHVLVTHGFLRSLARLELEESAIGRFRDAGPAGAAAQATNGHGPQMAPHEDVTVGDTPWLAVAAIGIAATVGVLAAAVALRSRR
jgi:hypothetical protein